ncbi:hypothetical protein GLYMA_09G159450v4 [Glycine max]|nr:hypothetical protein GLYMA_09G159450v4 [Glycine max]KAH1043225.1 hypothetical protein GYH30_025194 [Glycine max]
MNIVIVIIMITILTTVVIDCHHFCHHDHYNCYCHPSHCIS